jgi:glycosyltransferase involved in cell wall biosynthesis
MTDISFFSRDERTYRLFRSSWQRAAEESALDVQVVNRGFGLGNAWRAICKYVISSGTRRIVFGTSEICLYAMFSNARDIFVFTGLGRLLLDDGVVARCVRAVLRWTFRGQTVVVLNLDDQGVIGALLGKTPVLIDGEGYPFSGPAQAFPARPASNALTFAYVGRLLKSKGVDVLLGEFSRHASSDWTLLMVGDSDFSNPDALSAAELGRLARESKGKIEYLGFRQDVRAVLASVDFLVSLSRREGLPFSVLDGIEAGTHLVLTPVPGHLSFRDVSGVTFIEAGQLGQVFKEVSANARRFLEFDRAERLRSCEKKFGQATIVEAIKRLLVAPTGARAC